VKLPGLPEEIRGGILAIRRRRWRGPGKGSGR